MELIKAPVYFDTNVFIYIIDGYEEYQDLLSSLLHYIANNNILVVTSELTLAECLVKPIKDGNQKAIEQFKQHIQTSEVLKVKPVSREILINSASLRNELGLKLPDAIHMATAINQNCKTFVTNDQKLRVPEGIQRLYLKELLNNGKLIR
jgi:predicted nucleic acid-binding protein